jgi:hypothetical protein
MVVGVPLLSATNDNLSDKLGVHIDFASVHVGFACWGVGVRWAVVGGFRVVTRMCVFVVFHRGSCNLV